jgi:hypothetical protein
VCGLSIPFLFPELFDVAFGFLSETKNRWECFKVRAYYDLAFCSDFGFLFVYLLSVAVFCGPGIVYSLGI